jgi:hypothetical protein
MAAVDYAAEARAAYRDLLGAGGVATLTRTSLGTVDLATNTAPTTTQTAHTAGVLLPPKGGFDAMYAAGTLVRERHVRVLLAAVDASGAALTLAPQAGDVVTLGAQTVTIAVAPPVAPDGVTAVLYVCEAQR